MHRTCLAALTLVLAGANPVPAQRTLHWRTIDVEARLDAAGRIHVRETQTIVFTGDWNGGERRFDIRPRQDLDFQSIHRVDSTGATHAMRSGDLSVVDGYDFTNRTTLRWRSRLPTDPPFTGTPITYVIEFAIDGAMQRSGDDFVLDHDFAFADRAGVIEQLTVRLSLDDTWQATQPFAGTWTAANLPPGEGFVVRVPLRHAGTAPAPEVSEGAGTAERALIGLVVLGLLVSFGRRLVRREREAGRLDPLPPIHEIDRAWLEQHVLSQLPEVVGAAWDNSTNEPEVAATLARLAGDGRMASRVEPARGIFGQPTLHLTLLAPRSRFHGYERTLIDALFESGATETDTASIRERYKKTGFDPASKIRKPIERVVASLIPAPSQARAPFAPTALALLGGVILMGVGIQREPADAPLALIGMPVALVAYLTAVVGAVTWRNRVHDVGRGAGGFIVPQAIVVGVLLWILATGVTLAGTLTLLGLAFVVVGLANSVANQARSRESRDRIAYRRRLAAARAWFAAELKRPVPALEDAWFPYLIAFGLGKDMDRWFRAFGAAGDAMLHHQGGSSSSGSSHGGSSGGWSGFGGGGGFSGGGASASWTTAAHGLAAGVASPSSGGSGGGGGGGGGSSGGGGGGGW